MAAMNSSTLAPQVFRASRIGRRWRGWATFGLIALAPVLVVLTVVSMGAVTPVRWLPSFRLILLVDLGYVLVIAAVVMVRIARLIAARRSRSAGSQLHLRLSSVFAMVALVPAITVAAFAAITINIGLEGWFSDRVQAVVGNSLAAAQAYQAEQENTLRADGQAVADVLVNARRANPFIQEGEIRVLLSQAQAGIQRGLRVAFIIDGAGTLRLRGERSYLFDFIQPDADALQAALDGQVVLVRDWPNSEFRALFPLPGFADRILYVSRAVDGEILSLLDETQATIATYTQLEAERGQVLWRFALIYVGFATILILAAVLMGMSFAERLSRPIGRLAGAAEQVGDGNLDVQVEEARGDDEIATMGRVFNQMTRQLKGQRDALLSNTRQIEERRRLFDSVLTSVTAGVIGLDAQGRVDFVNRAAESLTGIHADEAVAQPLDQIVPEFAPLFARLQDAPRGALASRVQDEVRIGRAGRLESLLVRLAERRNGAGELEGYVVAFDDVTDLVSAQRMAAWGDVARRIAHEIKNPLTPIQLSADRIKRKFGRQLPEDEAEALQTLTDVIVRQTNDLRRIVDEFSRFARMPEPDRRPHDLVALVRDAVVLQDAGQPNVQFDTDLPTDPLVMDIDATMLTQAMTNLLKNASEATEGLVEAGRAPQEYDPTVQVVLRVDAERVVITIADNGIGLPQDRARLFEPYVTTREKGTGLGLPIVKKIIEEHGGTLGLRDAPVMKGCTHAGAMAEIRLPLLRNARTETENKTNGTEA